MNTSSVFGSVFRLILFCDFQRGPLFTLSPFFQYNFSFNLTNRRKTMHIFLVCTTARKAQNVHPYLISSFLWKNMVSFLFDIFLMEIKCVSPFVISCILYFDKKKIRLKLLHLIKKITREPLKPYVCMSYKLL